MNAKDIKKVLVDVDTQKRATELMLAEEIPGASVYHHAMLAGDEIHFDVDESFARILFLCSGSAVFAAANQEWTYDEKAVFVPGPDQATDVRANSPVRMIEIQWQLTPADRAEWVAGETAFPFTGKYADALQYRDPFKSEKTISRAIVPQRTIPRFAMGSVETYADDLIGQHEHPLLDQFFFSFPENHMELLLDDIVYTMEGDTLLHIPLACNHGVSVTGDQVAHYIWIDFLFDEEGNKYLDQVHKATGTMRSF